MEYCTVRKSLEACLSAALNAAVVPAAVAMLAAFAPVAQSQDPPPKPRTTMSGVYTPEQATRGQDTYNSICLSCHTLAEQSGTNFSKKWVGYPLWDLFDYLSVNMPSSDPGTLTPKEYAQVVAYMLKFNGMPAGKEEVPFDTVALKRIKVDTIPVDTLRKSSSELMKRVFRIR